MDPLQTQSDLLVEDHGTSVSQVIAEIEAAEVIRSVTSEVFPSIDSGGSPPPYIVATATATDEDTVMATACNATTEAPISGAVSFPEIHSSATVAAAAIPPSSASPAAIAQRPAQRPAGRPARQTAQIRLVSESTPFLEWPQVVYILRFAAIFCVGLSLLIHYASISNFTPSVKKNIIIRSPGVTVFTSVDPWRARMEGIYSLKFTQAGTTGNPCHVHAIRGSSMPQPTMRTEFPTKRVEVLATRKQLIMLYPYDLPDNSLVTMTFAVDHYSESDVPRIYVVNKFGGEMLSRGETRIPSSYILQFLTHSGEGELKHYFTGGGQNNPIYFAVVNSKPGTRNSLVFDVSVPSYNVSALNVPASLDLSLPNAFGRFPITDDLLGYLTVSAVTPETSGTTNNVTVNVVPGSSYFLVFCISTSFLVLVRVLLLPFALWVLSKLSSLWKAFKSIVSAVVLSVFSKKPATMYDEEANQPLLGDTEEMPVANPSQLTTDNATPSVSIDPPALEFATTEDQADVSIIAIMLGLLWAFLSRFSQLTLWFACYVLFTFFIPYFGMIFVHDLVDPQKYTSPLTASWKMWFFQVLYAYRCYGAIPTFLTFHLFVFASLIASQLHICFGIQGRTGLTFWQSLRMSFAESLRYTREQRALARNRGRVVEDFGNQRGPGREGQDFGEAAMNAARLLEGRFEEVASTRVNLESGVEQLDVLPRYED